jgi:hypothetical protein
MVEGYRLNNHCTLKIRNSNGGNGVPQINEGQRVRLAYIGKDETHSLEFRVRSSRGDTLEVTDLYRVFPDGEGSVTREPIEGMRTITYDYTHFEVLN